MLKFLNPWVIIAFILALGGATGYGIHLGKSMERAAQLKQLSLEEKIQVAIAEGVSKIKVRNTTIKQNLETITRENTIYRDCKLDPAAFGLLNNALTGKTDPAPGDRVVPTTNGTERQ